MQMYKIECIDAKNRQKLFTFKFDFYFEFKKKQILLKNNYQK